LKCEKESGSLRSSKELVYLSYSAPKQSIYFHVEDIDKKTLDLLDTAFCKLTVDQINQRQVKNESAGRVYFLVEVLGCTMDILKWKGMN
jgi:hypothetical protein